MNSSENREWPCQLQTSASHPAQSKPGLSTEVPSTGVGSPLLDVATATGSCNGAEIAGDTRRQQAKFPGENRPSTPSIAVAPKLVSSMQHPAGETHKANKRKELGDSACGVLQPHVSCLGEAPAFLLGGFEMHIVLPVFPVALA